MHLKKSPVSGPPHWCGGLKHGAGNAGMQGSTERPCSTSQHLRSAAKALHEVKTFEINF